jgi:hypothetical protein
MFLTCAQSPNSCSCFLSADCRPIRFHDPTGKRNPPTGSLRDNHAACPPLLYSPLYDSSHFSPFTRLKLKGVFQAMAWLRALQGPLQSPLDFNLHSTFDGEPRIPFSCYVQLEPMLLSGATFSQFSDFPAELQLRVFYFCNSPTFFQLM